MSRLGQFRDDDGKLRNADGSWANDKAEAPTGSLNRKAPEPPVYVALTGPDMFPRIGRRGIMVQAPTEDDLRAIIELDSGERVWVCVADFTVLGIGQQGSENDFDAIYSATAIDGTVDDSHHHSYEDALAAAGGNENRVWTVLDSGYGGDDLIWKFDLDGDQVTVVAAEEDSARESAAEELTGDDEREDEDFDIDNRADALNLNGVYRTDVGEDEEDEDDPDAGLTRASDMSIAAGDHQVDRMHWIVTDEEWADSNRPIAL